MAARPPSASASPAQKSSVRTLEPVRASGWLVVLLATWFDGCTNFSPKTLVGIVVVVSPGAAVVVVVVSSGAVVVVVPSGTVVVVVSSGAVVVVVCGTVVVVVSSGPVVVVVCGTVVVVVCGTVVVVVSSAPVVVVVCGTVVVVVFGTVVVVTSQASLSLSLPLPLPILASSPALPATTAFLSSGQHSSSFLCLLPLLSTHSGAVVLVVEPAWQPLWAG